MHSFIDTSLATLAYLAISFVLFFIGKVVYQLVHRKIKVKEELVEKDNFAFAVSHTGYFIGLLLAIGSAIVGPSHGILMDLLDIGIYGLLAIILLNISILINDKILLNRFSVYKEIIEDQNSGTGVIEAANSIATGLIIMGAVSGEGGGIDTALAFWGIGQVVIIITGFVYNLITPYNVFKEVEKDNIAAGIGFAGAIVALGNLIRYGLSDDFENWTVSLSNVGIEVLIGLILLPIVRFLSDRVLLPGQRLTDEIVNQEKPNIGASLIEAFSYIGGSVLITWCL